MGKLQYWLEKLQVPTEPGLSTAQLMLTNDDLRLAPLMDMVQFRCLRIADSLNVVGHTLLLSSKS
ncbi:hypothetical protein N7486_003700 [Penicillium sp. IBT 16267x]|nr:hypothetical protein N7486_003700 [Penicillium sp. IBT 16267x]